jgi:hypothetical protein
LARICVFQEVDSATHTLALLQRISYVWGFGTALCSCAALCRLQGHVYGLDTRDRSEMCGYKKEKEQSRFSMVTFCHPNHLKYARFMLCNVMSAEAGFASDSSPIARPANPKICVRLEMEDPSWPCADIRRQVAGFASRILEPAVCKAGLAKKALLC